jgi:hypothetical protein
VQDFFLKYRFLKGGLAMPRPPKPLSLVTGHLTDAEKAVRAQGEADLRTDEKIKPSAAVRENKDAMKYFKRLINLYDGIEMNEAFYENTINRYCILLAEHDSAVKDRERIERNIERLEERESEMEFKDYIHEANGLEDALRSADRILAKRRDQLLSIEKENLLTVVGRLRAVPKRSEEKKPSGIAAYRQRRGDG